MRDHGPGLPADKINRAFDKYARLHKKRKPRPSRFGGPRPSGPRPAPAAAAAPQQEPVESVGQTQPE